jgi:hypothetical protein
VRGKIKLGDAVEVTFLDHSSATGDAAPGTIECRPYGVVIGISAQEVALASWLDASGCVDHNAERLYLVRKAITSIRRLR